LDAAPLSPIASVDDVRKVLQHYESLIKLRRELELAEPKDAHMISIIDEEVGRNRERVAACSQIIERLLSSRS
jgi:hypothetical protein